MNRWVGLAFLAATAAASSTAIAGDWSGAYVGYGVTANRADMKYPNGYGEVIIDDVSTSGPDFDRTASLDRSALAAASHVIGGYLVQDGRWIVGVEGDLDLAQRQEFPPAFSAAPCLNPTNTAGFGFSCLGVDSFGTLQTYAHARALAGMELTPTMMGFVAGGVAFGTMSQTGLSVSSLATQGFTLATFGKNTATIPPKDLAGYSLGAGVQLKASERLLLRAEYLYDFYGTMNGVGVPVITGGSGGFTASATVTGTRNLNWVNQSLRISAIYRLGGGPNSAGGDPQPPADWSGPYLGGGITVSKTAMQLPGGSATSVFDPPGTGADFTTTFPLDRDGSAVGGHVLAGYRFQWNKLALGAEGDLEFGNGSDFPGPDQSVACRNPLTSVSIYMGCTGAESSGSFKVDGHARAVAGVELTPTTLGFVAAGAAFGHSGNFNITSQSYLYRQTPAFFVTSPVGNFGLPGKTMIGYSLGAGIEIKATPRNTIRVEYLYDRFDNAISNSSFSSGATIAPASIDTSGEFGTELDYISQTLRVSAVHQF